MTEERVLELSADNVIEVDYSVAAELHQDSFDKVVFSPETAQRDRIHLLVLTGLLVGFAALSIFVFLGFAAEIKALNFRLDQLTAEGRL